MLDGPIGDRDASADGLDESRSGNVRSSAGRSFDQHMRLKTLDEQLGSVVFKDLYFVDASQGTQNFGSFVGRDDGPVRAFYTGSAGVRVDRHDQVVALRAGELQQANVADVQQVEDAVGEYERHW